MLNLPKQPTCIDFKIVMFTNFLNLLTIFYAQHNKYTSSFLSPNMGLLSQKNNASEFCVPLFWYCH